MIKNQLVLLLIFLSVGLFGQATTDKKERNVGINYYGELGFRPGLELDYGIKLRQVQRKKNKITIEKQLNLRPSIAYYHYAHYSNNFLGSLKLNHQFRFVNNESKKYLFVEPFAKLGYLRYFFAGDVFETNNNGFNSVRFAGSNSIIYGGGVDFGGYISKHLDWLFGTDYYAESTEDRLVLHRFVAKLGFRVKINQK